MADRLSRKRLSLAGILLALFAILSLAPPAAAGGWVVITLDRLPRPVRAGDVLRLGFTVRQHGVTPINGVTPLLTAANPETGETITATAQQVGEVGHFEVAVIFPEAGAWEWHLQAPPFPQQTHFEPLTVLPAAAAGDARAAMRWAGAVLLGAAAVFALIGRRRRPALTAGSTA